MEKLTFKQLTRNILKDVFGLIQFRKHEVLDKWVEQTDLQIINNVDEQILIRLQNTLIKRSESWNEFEPSEWFIGPIISLLDFNTDDYSLFAFHELSAQIGNYELVGKPDVMFARGIDSAQIPYFFFHEYKKQTDPDGNPLTQLLGAMLAAQALNNNQKPIYGVYVIGYYWKFVILNNNQWCETNPYSATDEELFDIFKMLKALKEIIINF